MPLNLKRDILLQSVDFLSIWLLVQDSEHFIELLLVNSVLDLVLQIHKVRLFYFGLKHIFDIRPVCFPVQSIRHRLLVCFLGQRLCHKVKVCFLVQKCLDEIEVLLQGTVSDSLVDILENLFNLLVHLSKVHVDFVHIALGLEHPGQFFDRYLVADHVLDFLLGHPVLH